MVVDLCIQGGQLSRGCVSSMQLAGSSRVVLIFSKLCTTTMELDGDLPGSLQISVFLVQALWEFRKVKEVFDAF